MVMTEQLHDPEAFLPLTSAEFHILLALANKERHGYSIMQAIAERTQEKTKIGPATLYRSLKRLLDTELINEVKECSLHDSDDERRRYYRLTELGRQVVRAEVERLKELVSEAYKNDLMYTPGRASGHR